MFDVYSNLCLISQLECDVYEPGKKVKMVGKWISCITSSEQWAAIMQISFTFNIENVSRNK